MSDIDDIMHSTRSLSNKSDMSFADYCKMATTRPIIHLHFTNSINAANVGLRLQKFLGGDFVPANDRPIPSNGRVLFYHNVYFLAKCFFCSHKTDKRIFVELDRLQKSPVRKLRALSKLLKSDSVSSYAFWITDSARWKRWQSQIILRKKTVILSQYFLAQFCSCFACASRIKLTSL